MRKFAPTRSAMAASLACLGISLGSAAHADTTFKLSGYGTLAATHSSDSDYAFRSSMNQSVGASHGWDLGVDSKLGLQGVANFGNGWSLTGQLLGQRRRDDDTQYSNNDFNIDFDWLFAQYSFNSGMDLRLGRVVLPAFMISDSRNVGYSQPWLRAPMLVYAGMPMTSVDGIQLLSRFNVGNGVLTFQPTYGQANFNIQAGKFVLKDRNKWLAGVNLSYELGDWTVRGGHVRGRTPETNIAPLGVGTPGISYDMLDKFTSLGLQFDNGRAVVMAELAQRRMSNLPATGNPFWGIVDLGGGYTFSDYYAATLGGKPLAKSDASYIAAGWHFDSILPMVSFAQMKDKLTNTTDRETSVSVRYDFASNMAFKAQLTRIKAGNGFSIVNAAQAGDPAENKSIQAISVGLDFVF